MGSGEFARAKLGAGGSLVGLEAAVEASRSPISPVTDTSTRKPESGGLEETLAALAAAMEDKLAEVRGRFRTEAQSIISAVSRARQGTLGINADPTILLRPFDPPDSSSVPEHSSNSSKSTHVAVTSKRMRPCSSCCCVIL